MAQSCFPTRQFTSSEFVESCGAIIFDLSDLCSSRACVVKIVETGEYVLPKGRRNIQESRKDAALREAYEETGYRCELLPVRMAVRATAVGDDPDVTDKARQHEGLMEPFMCTVRDLPHDAGVKIIWWFIAVVSDINGERGPGENTFKVEFFNCDEAVTKLHFETDREVLRRAIELVEGAYGFARKQICTSAS
jgi:8-oxo-dGTP pyrophosphatase MutT (NUDIX family)